MRITMAKQNNSEPKNNPSKHSNNTQIRGRTISKPPKIKPSQKPSKK